MTKIGRPALKLPAISSSRLSVVALGALLVILGISIWYASTARLHTPADLKAYVTQKPETYTELFFTNYQDIPKSLEAGHTYEGSFTIRSHESDLQTYRYVIDRYENGKLVKNTAKTVTLEPGHTVRLPFELTASAPGLQVTLSILLEGHNQAIHVRAAS